ncbi:porin family protein [Hymenobacter ginkgonis]|nr:porin family protein [Hymenobacter ginkgonis]
MKPFLSLVAGSLLLAGTAHAQAGLRAGGTLAHLTAKTEGTPSYYFEASNSAKLGYQLGLFYQVPLSQRLSLVPEVQFSRERVQLTARDNNFAILEYFGTTDTRLSMSYLNVPVLLRASFGPVYVEAGPQAGLRLAGREKGTYTVSFFDRPLTTNPVDRPLADDLRRFDVGPCVGLGVKLPAGLGVSVRAYQGLVSLTPGPDPTRAYPYQGSLRRQTLQAALTYQLAAR